MRAGVSWQSVAGRASLAAPSGHGALASQAGPPGLAVPAPRPCCGALGARRGRWELSGSELGGAGGSSVGRSSVGLAGGAGSQSHSANAPRVSDYRGCSARRVWGRREVGAHQQGHQFQLESLTSGVMLWVASGRLAINAALSS